MRLNPPSRLIVNDQAAWLWQLSIDRVPYQAVWWLSDGTLRVAWWASEHEWSPFVKLGPKWSPQFDFDTAQATVKAWASCRNEHVTRVFLLDA